jgi:hypothetical protein
MAKSQIIDAEIESDLGMKLSKTPLECHLEDQGCFVLHFIASRYTSLGLMYVSGTADDPALIPHS